MSKFVWVCRNCGHETNGYFGQCSSCGAWGTLEKETIIKTKTKATGVKHSLFVNSEDEILRLSEIGEDSILRLNTGSEEFNRVLGGGIVPASVNLIGGQPGIGKSTLLLQLAFYFSLKKLKVLYVSAEESSTQLKMRAKRLNSKGGCYETDHGIPRKISSNTEHAKQKSVSYEGRVAERTSSRLRRTNDRNVLGVHEDHEDDKNAEIGVRQHAYDWVIESSPIKGTADLSKKNELLISEKEKAEHIMIIDLIRNDLSRISKTGSVKVSEFMEIKKFKNLFHLVSKVSSVLNEDSFLKISSEHRSSKPWMTNKSQNFTSIPDLEKIFSATFPGGSITGTPKIRAMEIIKELEGIKRGPYTGSIGYFKFHEGGEFNIIIRSLVYDKIKQELSFHSGAGITSGSNPEEEFKEIQLKAEKIYQSLGSKAVNY